MGSRRLGSCNGNLVCSAHAPETAACRLGGKWCGQSTNQASQTADESAELQQDSRVHRANCRQTLASFLSRNGPPDLPVLPRPAQAQSAECSAGNFRRSLAPSDHPNHLPRRTPNIVHPLHSSQTPYAPRVPPSPLLKSPPLANTLKDFRVWGPVSPAPRRTSVCGSARPFLPRPRFPPAAQHCTQRSHSPHPHSPVTSHQSPNPHTRLPHTVLPSPPDHIPSPPVRPPAPALPSPSPFPLPGAKPVNPIPSSILPSRRSLSPSPPTGAWPLASRPHASFPSRLTPDLDRFWRVFISRRFPLPSLSLAWLSSRRRPRRRDSLPR